MSRFLARAIAAVMAETQEPHAEGLGGFGGFGGFGEPADGDRTEAQIPALRGFGSFGGFGDSRASDEAPVLGRAALPQSGNADAALAWADRDTARRLTEAIQAGATCERCPTGALDVALRDGRLWMLAPAKVARMMAVGLLPEAITNRRTA